MDDTTVSTAQPEAIERMDTSWRAFLATLDGIPEDRLEEPGAVGEWSVKDVLGHIAFWDAQAIEALRRRLAGEPDRDVDWQAMNDAAAAERAGRPLSAAWDELHQTHQRLQRAVENAVKHDPTMDATVCGCLKEDAYEHYDEHATEIRAWRQRVGLERGAPAA